MNDAIKTISIPEQHLSQIREFYQGKIAELEKQLSDLRSVLSSLNGSSVKPQLPLIIPDGNAGYNVNWSFSKKIKFIIQTAGHPITTREIVDTLVQKYEPQEQNNRKKVVATVSSILSTGAKNGSFIKTTDDSGQNLYYNKTAR